MPVALALSPHLDDAAFSAGATLARLAGRGWRVVVATVFTGNVARPEGFALACQLDKGLPPEADYMAIRRAEDEAACAALGAEAVHLPHLEAPHRGYEDALALFAGVRAGDEAGAAVAGSVAEALDRYRPALLLLPRAVGGHVDHVVVRRAVQRVERALPRTLFWTDWPYASREAPRDPFAVQDAGRRVLDVPTASCLPAKLAACAAYATQLGFQFGGGAGMRGSVGAVAAERFVVSPPS